MLGLVPLIAAFILFLICFCRKSYFRAIRRLVFCENANRESEDAELQVRSEVGHDQSRSDHQPQTTSLTIQMPPRTDLRPQAPMETPPPSYDEVVSGRA